MKQIFRKISDFFLYSAGVGALVLKLVLLPVLCYGYLMAVCVILDAARVINTDGAAYFTLFSFLALCVAALVLAVKMIRRYCRGDRKPVEVAPEAGESPEDTDGPNAPEAPDAPEAPMAH